VSRINRWTLTALALVFLLGLARHAAAQPPQIAEAHQQIALGLYRTAELTAKEALQGSPSTALPTCDRQEWLVLLTEVYYRSRQYDQALERLREARQLLDRQRQLHPGYEYAFAKPRLGMALWQTRIELAQAAMAAKTTALRPPSGFVNDDIPAEGLSLPEQADRLELLVLRAQLGDLRDEHASPPDRVRRWSPLRLQAETLLKQTYVRVGLAEPQASILLSLARCCEAEGNPKQAVDILRAVAFPPSGAIVNPRVKELRTETARILRRAKLFSEEAHFWQDVLAGLRTAEADPDLAKVERLNLVAGIHFDRAETLHFAGTAADVVKQELSESETNYLQALKLNQVLASNLQQRAERWTRSLPSGVSAPALAANHQQQAELRVSMTVSLQGLLRIRLTPEQWNKRQEYSLDKDDVDSAVKLHDLLKATRIADDPLVHHLEATLGAQYLRAGKITPEAKDTLEDAYKFFKTYRFAPATQVQLLVLLAEIDRYEGCYDGAKSKLEEAVSRYDEAGLKDTNLRLWIDVHRGRLAAAGGRFAEAKTCYDRVVDKSEEAGSEAADAGNMARLGLAMLYKGFGQLDKAEAMCREALAHRTPSSPTALGDPAIVPYHVALAGILILEGKLDAAEGEVDTAQRLLKNPVDRGTPPACELLHLAAMLKFLRYKEAVCDVKLAVQGVEASMWPLSQPIVDASGTSHTASYKARPCEDLAADKIADAAKQSWRELRVMQEQNGDRPGEARTDLYLSQLCFFRWQQQALRHAHDDLKKCQRELDQYRQNLAKLTTAESTYREDYECWTKKTVAERRSSFRDLEERWQGLDKEREKLTKTARNLRSRKEEALARYDAVRSDMLPNPARSAAVNSAPSVPREVEPGEIKAAQDWARQAADILEKSPLYPSLQYITLSHRAAVLRAAAAWHPDQEGEALKCLKHAVTLLENPRLSLSEGDVARAEFLSQYTQAFDQLIEWHHLHGRPLDALVYAELCRNRTLLDWIRSNSDDTQRQAADPLHQRAEEAFKESTRLGRALERMDKVAKSGVLDSDVRNETLKTFNAAKKQYEELQKEILKKTTPGQAGFGEVLDFDEVKKILQERIRDRNELVIYYHVGVSNSYLFVLGLDPEPRVIRLQCDELREDLTRHVSATRVQQWSDEYHKLFERQGAFPNALRSEGECAHLAWITERLLPRELRHELAEAMRRRNLPLIVSPAGSLQQIPFDALVVPDDNRQPFLIDHLPHTGITYTPSLVILKKQERSDPPQTEPPLAVPSVVTVACGDFSSQRATHRASATAGLRNLPLATKESDAVAGIFAEGAHRLQGVEATKGHFRRQLDETKPTCVHLATHSLASEFTPVLVLYPGVGAAGVPDDGLLTVGEIYGLPLAGCRLAVLSACRTNRGPELPGEMAMSVSRGFLAAGARRVLASQWAVADQAACDCVRSFLAEVAHQWKAGEPCNYAAAMIAARWKLRSDRDDPFYWAPFILIGPACDVTQGSKGQPPPRLKPPSEKR
jgi:CHAT domain-containing protein/tetratricopeptide (TPR) repeat protein